MKNLMLMIFCLIIIIPLGAVHNFTVNGLDTATITVGDSIHFEFEFENAGNSADFDLSIELLEQNIPLFSGNYLLFQDGGLLDETGLDGSFSGGINNFIQFPEGTTLVITLTDEEISDEISLEFEQLNSNYSISGTVLQEGEWMDLPVMGGLVYTVYNGGLELLQELLVNFEMEAFLEFIAAEHYVLSDLSGLLGNYQIFVPDDITDVTCSTGVYSILDMEGSFIPPDFREDTVNGHETGIDFMYYLPDGEFYGLVIDENGNGIENAGFIMENPNSALPYFFYSDSLGNFSISLSDQTYSYMVTTIGYEVYTDSVTINGDDVFQEITLSEIGTEPDAQFFGYVLSEDNEAIVNAEIVVIPIDPGGETQFHYSMNDGSFSFDLTNGTYSYMISHNNYEGITGNFEIAGEDLFMEFMMTPIAIATEMITSVDNVSCYPNPFNPEVVISFSIGKMENVSLNIYNIRGELVKNLMESYVPAGKHKIPWNGTDLKNSKCSSGIYFYQLLTEKKKYCGRMLLMK